MRKKDPGNICYITTFKILGFSIFYVYFWSCQNIDLFSYQYGLVVVNLANLYQFIIGSLVIAFAAFYVDHLEF